jgi:hypothetical protein
LVKRYDCKRQIVHVGLVYSVSDEVQVGMDGFIGYTIALVGGDEVWEHLYYSSG